MITIELTDKQIEYLTEQARLYGGRFGLLTETTEGAVASVVLVNGRRDRRKTAAKTADAEGELK